jgi:hypothetical protein
LEHESRHPSDPEKPSNPLVAGESESPVMSLFNIGGEKLNKLETDQNGCLKIGGKHNSAP